MFVLQPRDIRDAFCRCSDTNPEMRCVLGLFEGIVTGAADGYGRMSGLPAATLTHLGPGLGMDGRIYTT